MSISGAILSINPTAALLEQTGYYVLIDVTAIDDYAGNSFAGIAVKTTWNFTTADETAPTISVLSPVDNGSVLTTANLVATFSENMQFGGTVSISIKKSSDDSVFASYTAADIGGAIAISGNQLTINPTSDLADATDYYVLIAAGSIQDLSGNNFAGIVNSTTWNFTATIAAVVVKKNVILFMRAA